MNSLSKGISSEASDLAWALPEVYGPGQGGLIGSHRTVKGNRCLPSALACYLNQNRDELQNRVSVRDRPSLKLHASPFETHSLE